MARQRIPEVASEFNTYIINTEARLMALDPANPPKKYWETYGLLLAEQGAWTAKKGEWVILYAKYSDPQLSTSIIKNQLRDFMGNFSDFASPLLDRIDASGKAGQVEAGIFNIDIERDKPTIPTTPITESCFASIKSAGTGQVEITCRTANDQSRASKPDNADGFQMVYTIADAKPTNIPAANDAVMDKEFFSRAKTTHDFGADKQGKWLVTYFRWYDSKRPNLAGPLSNVQVVVIG